MKQLNQITAQTLLALDRNKTVFLIPIGGIEDGGADQPLGAALEAAEKKCIELAEKIETQLDGFEAVLFSKSAFCVSGTSKVLTLKNRGYVLKDWLLDSIHPLIKKDFLYFICISGTRTPKTLTAIEEAGKSIRQKYAWRRALGGMKLNFKAPLLISLESADAAPSQMFSQHPKPPVLIEDVFSKVQAVLEGANPESLFRSWYSIVPTNRTFFRAWLLMFGVIIIIAAWVWLNFNFSGI